ncbi:hypothetical protein SKAU_G00231590 [Synaphobranchus kaupii]|uniref:Uncharacterized protein n=1 Tax=Synaphobranchus kaupii TaxID=118154 RepID=A0A9Q1IR95_SYNKA|nr:hypothetical protein SKAU_G00231590 [Synaphobranchus kaupii]
MYVRSTEEGTTFGGNHEPYRSKQAEVTSWRTFNRRFLMYGSTLFKVHFRDSLPNPGLGTSRSSHRPRLGRVPV